jgi:hypothetical protein
VLAKRCLKKDMQISMLAMLYRGMEPFVGAICKRGSCLSPSAGPLHHDDVIAWSLGEFVISTVVSVGLVVQRQREKR